MRTLGFYLVFFFRKLSILYSLLFPGVQFYLFTFNITISDVPRKFERPNPLWKHHQSLRILSRKKMCFLFGYPNRTYSSSQTQCTYTKLLHRELIRPFNHYELLLKEGHAQRSNSPNKTESIVPTPAASSSPSGIATMHDDWSLSLRGR